MSQRFNIGDHSIGAGAPCFVIAEAGVNHNGDVAIARALVDAAVAGRADAVKFQTFRADALVTQAAPKAAYQRETTGAGESQWTMLKRLELSADLHADLAGYCRRAGIHFLSTPFDEDSADLLERLGVPAFKVSSGEVTNLPLLAHIAGKRRPMILSTGMSTLGEVETAMSAIAQSDPVDVALLHCVSNYPAAPADANLRAMATLRLAFDCPVGFSDHTRGSAVALAAVALGANIVEKHLTIDRALDGPDHRASMEPGEFAALVRDIRDVEAALGHGRKEPAESERDVAAVARKSLVAARALAPGTALDAAMVERRRPGDGLPPATLQYLIGRRLRRAVAAGHVLRLDDFE